jgi:phenylacetate-CoA ligase
MNIALYLRNNLKHISPSIGQLINRIPYSMHPGIGNIYRHRQKDILLFDSLSIEQQHNFILERMRSVVYFAYHNIPFYNRYYTQNKFHPDDLKSYQDIKKIPIIDKLILRSQNIEERSTFVPNRYIVNTGGSSGIPFAFYIEPTSMGHEWAHAQDMGKIRI